MHKPYTVLVVEDEVLIRLDISHHLEACGFKVLEAEDAGEAIRILLARRDIDLVFTDVRMPGSLDGLGLARWIMQQYPDMPVMIASGEAAKAEALEELCSAETFRKPYQPEQVSRRMLEVLARQAG